MFIFSILSWYSTNLLDTILFFIILFLLSPQFKNTKNIYIALTISIIFSFLDYYLDGISLIASFIFIIIIRKSTNYSWLSTISFFILAFLITSITQNIASSLLIDSFGTRNLSPSTLSSIIIVVINYILSLLLAFLIKYFFKRKSISSFFYDKTVRGIIGIAIVITLVCYLVLMIVFNYLQIPLSYLRITLIISAIIIILIGIGAFLFISSRLKEIKLESEIKNLKERNIYIKELERKNIELRKFKHDYKNFLLSLSASLKSNDIQNDSIRELLNYADANVGSNLSIENASLYKLQDSLVRGIIITKLIYAKNQNIETNFEIDENANIPQKESVEITRILGILFDNAIEASLFNDYPQLNFAIISFSGYIELIIKNNIKEQENIDINKIYTTGYTTKKEHSGLGLSTVREIINSNDNLLLQTKFKDGYFTTILTVLEDK
ncbi:histidine kinase [Companilactobacillus crustorum]|uniref:Sensor histidine kinase NatK-like C-terminal domain-containing protein n=3 Tax=Companilactobacillus TaxID=2767879 RepID=A0A837RHE4_9LACO|nr:GHKL domain-containing protein [Companilactobacillus crustorum]KRK42686.1 hypothetical protein FD26_GL000425 [Companilactobacillus crustorum JCM 15951]KRO21292.1 hypothetical protein IV63_GL001751 [Companilactobacillus crustorum]GEO76451.1 histidine kinase [Companilactobacillus crustorum]